MPKERIEIRWYAIPNGDARRGGFLPVYELNGKLRGDTWGKGYDLDEAERRAKADALDEASRYVGDWEVSVERKALTRTRPAAELDREIDEWARGVSSRAARARTERKRGRRP